jgi:hypothetical protein
MAVMQIYKSGKWRVIVGLTCVIIFLGVAVAASGAKRRAVAPRGVGAAAARVNGSPIYKIDVDAKATIVASRLSPPPAIEDVRSSVLLSMVRQEILYQTAPKYGIRITDAEITEALGRTMQDIFSPEMDVVSRQEALGYMQRMGLTVEQYPNDPRVIDSYRRTYMIEKMRQWVMDRVPLEQRTSSQAIESAVDEFIEQQHATVTYP